MPAISQTDVIGVGQYAVSRIEPFPANVRNVQLEPRMRGVRLRSARAHVASVDVAADIASRYAEQARHANEQVGKILADAFLADEHLVGSGFQLCAAGQILV